MGTMTFGSTCDENEAFKILDYAYEQGIDFYDTAEVYPIPPDISYVNETEKIVGRWLKTKPRDSVILATKVAGPGHGWFSPPIRSGKTSLDRHHIRTAIEGSLTRLQTDYIDLYQTHWPDHGTGYEETLYALDELANEGKIRYAGCSNENTYGLMKSLATAAEIGTLRYESIQNNYSILNRRFEDELAQAARAEKVSLLPYSPLGGGVVTGKYNDDPLPENARFSRYAKMTEERQRKMANRFLNSKTLETTNRLRQLADEAGMSVTVLALAFSKAHDFVASTIVGANTLAQLQESLKAKDVTLTDEVMRKIDKINAEILYPMG
ncbi:MAG: aldo/keto reductase [Leptospiraceae bacterium]|nr:aldo/keto reductase [Leptospiraceae bacterium]